MFDLHVNPFTEDVFSGTLETEPTLPALYAGESKQLLGVVEMLRRRQAAFGRGVGLGALLVSPKAGAGKTHFLARLAQEHRSKVHVCRLVFGDPDEMSWSNWCRELLLSFHRSKELQSDHSVLTGRTAFALANATSELIAEGAIPCESPATASNWLSEHSRKLFDANEASNPSVQWFKSEYDSLLPQVVNRYARTLDVDASVLSIWLDWLFRYSSLSAGEGNWSDRRAAQDAFVLESELFETLEDESIAKAGIRVFGRLMTSEMPLIFAVDDLDWFYRDEASALRLARMLSEFSKWVPRSLALISVNEDVWKETFVKGLPEAVRDRLAAYTITLKGVPRSLWNDFLSCHAEPSDVATNDLERLTLAVTDDHADETRLMPRQLIRAAAMAWLAEAPEEEQVEAVSSERKIVVDDAATTPAPDRVKETQERVDDSDEAAIAQKEDEASASLWVNAMGDIRSLIDSRQSKTVTASSGASATDEATTLPEKPQLTAEFRSFLSSLRARSDDKKGYEPQVKHTAAELEGTVSPGKARSELIRHGNAGGPLPEPVALPVGSSNRTIAPWIVARLREVKASLVGSSDLNRIHLGRLRQLIIAGGERFPAVEQDLSGTSSNPSGVRWIFQQSEVNFGFEPYSDEAFWKRLVSNTASRARDLRESEKTRVKLVVFQRADDESSFPSWSHSDAESMDLQFCDVVSLSDAHLLTLYSLERLLADEPDTQRREDSFMQLSGELDFFWKMVTRPVWAVVSEFSKEPSSVAL